ncbi:neuronal cell adhesion molecule-like [Amphiura filiformis]|uniref:neuronal cell adhesion molecule-like n=1 Tax=Amphiura filiformis TaxID=82378 RepID=UPI003B22342A
MLIINGLQTKDVCIDDTKRYLAPTITLQPKPARGYDIFIMDKRVPIRLSCDATGTPPPRFKWVKYDRNGENPVDLDPNDDRVTMDGGNLEVGDPEDPGMKAETAQERVEESDEGLYQCIAENTFGSALSKKVNASIAFLDAFSWVERKIDSYQIGEKVVLNCDPPNGVPSPYPAIYWTFGMPGDPKGPRNPVVYSDRVLQDVQGNLVFANIQEQDSRDYVCNVPNAYIGEVKTSPIFEVTVNTNRPAPTRGPSWVYKPPQSKEVLRTKILQLKCIAEGL